MSKGIIKFESKDEKMSMLEYILRVLDKKGINYTVKKKDQLHIVDTDEGSDIFLFEEIMKKAERRGYENFVD
jgi:hypothetical protein|tara:strand:+ start:4333 stop:4548 length:216 start_codon:yes stop_codon:yes gene_type:complete